MAKPKAPLLSLDATNTLAGQITFQKRGRTTIARAKPTPRYTFTLPQAYQRWLYQDYAHLWLHLTAAQKRTWETNARPYHMTGFAYFLKDRLTYLRRIVLGYHLDELSGNLARDFSRQANNGTIYGALAVPGRIDLCRLFDGIDDYIYCLNPPEIKTNTLGTVTAWIKTTTGAVVFSSGQLTASWPYLMLLSTGFYSYDLITSDISINNEDAIDGQWHHVAWVSDGTLWKFYVDGIPKTLVWLSGSNHGYWWNYYNTDTFDIGILHQTVFYGPFDGLIDEVRVYNRILDEFELLRQSERRYP